MNRADLQPPLAQGIAALGLALPTDCEQRLLDYLALLEKWNAHFNLTAVRDPAEMVPRHLLDSLAVLPYLAGASVADIGSGAGLPGIPLALASPQRQFTLIDSNGKKARFLRAAVRELGLDNVEVVQARVEAIDACFACVTARALAELDAMLAQGGHLLPAGGRLLAMKGRYPAHELDAVAAPFRVLETAVLKVPGVDAERHLVIIERG